MNLKLKVNKVKIEKESEMNDSDRVKSESGDNEIEPKMNDRNRSFEDEFQQCSVENVPISMKSKCKFYSIFFL